MSEESPVTSSLVDPLQERIEDGTPAIGLYINDAKTVELAAHMGFDWFMLDQMFTNHGWEKTENLIRTAQAAGITPIVRVHSYPWTGYDPHVVANVSRNIGIGANYVMVSHSGLREIEEALPLAHEYHMKESHIFPYDDILPHSSGQTTPDEEMQANIIPHFECEGAFEEIEAVMEKPEVNYCFLALTDAMQELTGEDRPDWDDPRIWEFVDEVAELGERTDTVIGANPSFHGAGTDFTYSLQVLEDRVVELYERGIDMIMAQSAPMIFQLAGGQLLGNLSDRLPR
jgi:4-hydroxy-2-oxoheptanedioate aldolase